MSRFLFLAILCLGAISCRDTASTGFLCNFSDSNIEFVMEPIDTALYAQQINGGRIRVLSYDPVTMRAEIDANDGQCLWIANGTNGLSANNLFIDYLEIRRSSGSDFFLSKEEIFAQFIEVQNDVYEIQVRE